ncbi:MAG: hypothetical protein IJ066_12640, partial [Bacteroidaceae bacterium]|nr:hypothetical protein [Bacteroidaceae bacterium]
PQRDFQQRAHSGRLLAYIAPAARAYLGSRTYGSRDSDSRGSGSRDSDSRGSESPASESPAIRILLTSPLLQSARLELEK